MIFAAEEAIALEFVDDISLGGLPVGRYLAMDCRARGYYCQIRSRGVVIVVREYYSRLVSIAAASSMQQPCECVCAVCASFGWSGICRLRQSRVTARMAEVPDIIIYGLVTRHRIFAPLIFLEAFPLLAAVSMSGPHAQKLGRLLLLNNTPRTCGQCGPVVFCVADKCPACGGTNAGHWQKRCCAAVQQYV